MNKYLNDFIKSADTVIIIKNEYDKISKDGDLELLTEIEKSLFEAIEIMNEEFEECKNNIKGFEI